MARPLLLGHRGCRLGRRSPIAENTIAAFDFCMESGCDGFEFDVRQTSDGQLAICHDATFGGRALATTPYSQFQPTLPCLEVVLRRFRDTAFFDIELKASGYENKLIELLASIPPARGFVVSSFLPEVIDKLHALNSDLPLGIIFDRHSEAQSWRHLPVTHAMPNLKLLTQDLLRELQASGKRVMPWTVNAEGDMQRLADWGVDALISDDPEQLSSVFGRSRG
jgi:glycerophosphoryl diester phosphodiesterase